jgi:hypothetical protein
MNEWMNGWMDEWIKSEGIGSSGELVSRDLWALERVVF